MEELPVDPNALALVQELRAVATLLADRETDAAAVAEMLPLARDLRARLVGPRRERWYDLEPGSPTASEAARSSYQNHSPLRGQLSPIAPPMAIERVEGPDGLRLVGRVRLSCAYEGPPHGVHGGVVAALFDEILGGAQNLAPPVGVTAKLEIRYRQLTPIDEDLRFEAWIEQQRGRRVRIRGTCHAGETLTADARGLFVRVDFAEVRQRMSERQSQ